MPQIKPKTTLELLSTTNSDDTGSSQSHHSDLIRSSANAVLDSPKPTKAKVTKSAADDIRSSKLDIVRTENGLNPVVITRAKGRKAVRPKTRKESKSIRSASALKSETKMDDAKSAINDHEHAIFIPPASVVMASRRSSSVPASKQKESRSQPANSLMTDYFPVRRSNRMTKTELKKQEQQDLEKCILSKKEDVLKEVKVDGKGRGVVATTSFAKGDFVVEYAGNLIDHAEAKRKEIQYSDTQKYGCYMYYFNYKNKNYCVDATDETGRLGRLINHSRVHPNCVTKVVEVAGVVHLILVAAKTIEIGEEFLYDYGDRSKESLDAHPWLAL